MLSLIFSFTTALLSCSSSDNKGSINPDTPSPPVLKAYNSLRVNGATLVMIYNEDLDESSPPKAEAFLVSVDGAPGKPPATVALRGSTLTLTLATPVQKSQTVTLSYISPEGSDAIQDASGDKAESLTSQPVDNITGLPQISIAKVYPQAMPHLAPAEFKLTLSERLSEEVVVRVNFVQEVNYLNSSFLNFPIPPNETELTLRLSSSYGGSESGPLVAVVVSDTGYASASTPNHLAEMKMVATQPAVTLSWEQEEVSVEEGETAEVGACSSISSRCTSASCGHCL